MYASPFAGAKLLFLRFLSTYYYIKKNILFQLFSKSRIWHQNQKIYGKKRRLVIIFVVVFFKVIEAFI